MTDIPFTLPHGHFDQIQKCVRSYMGTIKLAIVGGSQVLRQHNGQPMTTQNSDTDVLLLSDYSDHPVSLTVYIEGHRYDLICRDPSTLAFDLNTAPAIGRGILAQIATTGQAIYNPHGWAETIQAQARAVFEQGPLPITSHSVRTKQHFLFLAAYNNGSADKSHDHHLIAGMMLAQEIAETSLRLHRLWSGKGKILGRKLHEHGLGRLNNAITDAFSAYQIGDPEPFIDMIKDQFLSWHVAGNGAVPLKPEQHLEVMPITLSHASLAAAFTNARLHDKVIGPYLSSDHPAQIVGAKQWLYSKFSNAAAAVTPDRINRAGHEYFYATAKLLDVILRMGHFVHSPRIPQSLEQSIEVALQPEHLPYLANDVRTTLAGDPGPLVQTSANLLHQLVGPDFNLSLPRYSPSHYRQGPLQTI